MKRLLSFLSIMLLSFSLFACDNDEVKVEEVSPTTVNDMVSIFNDLIKGTAIDVQYDDYAGYVSSNEYGDAAASMYVMNNYMVPLMIQNIAEGMIEAEVTTTQAKKFGKAAKNYIEYTIQLEQLEQDYYYGLIDLNEYYDALFELQYNAPSTTDLLSTIEAEQLAVVLFTALQGLDDEINDKLDTIVAKDEEAVKVQISLIETTISNDTFAKACDLTEEDLEDIVLLTKVTLGNAQTLFLDLEDLSTNLIFSGLSKDDISKFFNGLLDSYSKTYGTVSKQDIEDCFNIVNDLMGIFVPDYPSISNLEISAYSTMIDNTLNTVENILITLVVEENLDTIHEFIEYSFELNMDTTLEINQELVNDFMCLLATIYNSSFDGKDTLSSSDLDMLLGTSGFDGGPGQFEYLADCSEVIVNYKKLSNPTASQTTAYETALYDFSLIISSLLLGM